MAKAIASSQRGPLSSSRVVSALLDASPLTTLLLAGVPAHASETIDARNCEVFIDKITIASRGASYAGSYFFSLDFKVLDERLDAPLQRIFAFTTEDGQTTETEAVPADGLAFRLTYNLGGYYPIRFKELKAEFYAETTAGTLYHVVPGSGGAFVIDENAYHNVKSQGTTWYDPYFNASSGTQAGHFAGYYNPQNCY